MILTSDEREETIQAGLQLLKSVLPSGAFYGKGPDIGPDVVMIDDSSAERGAITKCWPQVRVLLCTFHFLQRQWTWLYEGKNKISKDDRVTLIQEIRQLVNTRTEESLQSLFDQLLKLPVSLKYPHFVEHLKSLWTKRYAWAHCYRKRLLIRGNHTNNYAEAGIKILKELVFSRVKAYNLVQMFTFVYDIMDMYYQKKLIAISNHRFETYVSLRFQGLNAKKVTKANITVENGGWYKVKSCTSNNYYDVNVNIGVCTCEHGQDGSPCVHQAAVVLNFGQESINYIATLSANARLKLAIIALGSSAIQQLSFYSSLHQQSLEERMNESKADVTDQCSNFPTFQGSEWDLIRSNGDHIIPSANSDNTDTETPVNIDEVLTEVDSFASTLKLHLQQNDHQLVSGVKKFLTRYKDLAAYRSTARLASAFHQFGWVFGGTISRTNFHGNARHGKRIAVQATSAGRRRAGSLRGKARVPSGRPATSSAPSQCSTFHSLSDRHLLPTRKQAKGKRVHSLSRNIAKGLQNAGKW